MGLDCVMAEEIYRAGNHKGSDVDINRVKKKVVMNERLRCLIFTVVFSTVIKKLIYEV